MSIASRARRGIRFAVASALCLVLTGCGLASRSDATRLTFTNVSSSWLDVDVFVAARDHTNAAAAVHLIGDEPIQVSPGQTATYSLAAHSNFSAKADPLVHIRVRPVVPSWEQAGAEYWMELLTRPPVTIVATGTEERVEFITGDGALAMIPSSMVHDRTFTYESRPRDRGTGDEPASTAHAGVNPDRP